MKSLEELCGPEGKMLESATQDAKITKRLMWFFKTAKALVN
jgi:hypothetical protein